MHGSTLRCLVLCGLTLAAQAGLVPRTAQAQEAEPRLAFTGRGFGTYAALGNLVLAPESAPAFLSCDPGSEQNSIVSQEVAPLFQVGTIVNTAEGVDDHSFKSATTTDTVEGVSLLGGLITADVVTATSETTYDLVNFGASGNANLVNLRLLGLPLGVSPRPNTTLPLVGIGHVTFNEQISGTTSSSGFSQVNAVHVVVTLTNPLLEVGTEVIVGSARSRLQIVPAFLRGAAYGTVVRIGGVNVAGPLPLEGIPCWGTNGIVQENHVTALDLPGILTAGSLTSTTFGVFTPSTAAEAVSKIEGLDLLGGLVTADLLRAETELSTNAKGQPTFSVAGTQFVNLSVLGFPEIDDSVPFNTRIEIPGLGDLWLKLLIQESDRWRLWMVFLNVLQENALGLPIGSQVQLGAANVGLE